MAALSAEAQAPITAENAFGLEVSLPSPPQIVGASNCRGLDVWSVSVRGGHPNNGEYDLYFGSPINGVPFALVATAPVGATSPTVITVDLRGKISGVPPSFFLFMAKERRRYPVSSPPGAMQTVVSDESNYLTLRDPDSLPKPFIAPTPLFVCGAATAVGGHQPGDRVRLVAASGATRFQLPQAFGTYDFVGEISPSFSNGEKVYAEYSTCDGQHTSPSSATETVIPFPMSRLPTPQMTRIAAVAGVAALPVLGVEHGARLGVQLVRAGEPVETQSRVCVGGEPCVISVPPSWKTFHVGDQIYVSQALCPDSDSTVLRWSVSSCYDQAPRLARFPANGDRSLVFSDYALGSWLIASICLRWRPQVGCDIWQQIGSVYGAETLQLTQPLRAGDRVAVSQQTGDGCPPLRALLYVVP